jgi:hypothetical protein
MIRKLIISAKAPKGTLTLLGNYYDKKTRKNLHLVENGKRVITEMEYDDYTKQFDILLTDASTFTLEYDDSSKNESAVVDFYLNHPLCTNVNHTNPNLVSPLFIVVMQHMIVENEISSMNENLDTAIKCLSLGFDEKHDLAFALGIDARGLTHKELVSRLVGPNLTGDAIQQKHVFDHYYDSLETDRKVKVYVTKAITTGIIQQENGYYRVGGRTLGSQERDVIDMCNSDKDFFYGFIVPEVDKVVDVPNEKLDDYVETDITSVVSDKLEGVRKIRAKKNAIIDKLIV